MRTEQAIEVARRELRLGMEGYEDGEDADPRLAQECRDALAMLGRLPLPTAPDAAGRLEGQLDRLEALLGAEESSGITFKQGEPPCPECGEQTVRVTVGEDGDGRTVFYCERGHRYTFGLVMA